MQSDQDGLMLASGRENDEDLISVLEMEAAQTILARVEKMESTIRMGMERLDTDLHGHTEGLPLEVSKSRDVSCKELKRAESHQ